MFSRFVFFAIALIFFSQPISAQHAVPRSNADLDAHFSKYKIAKITASELHKQAQQNGRLTVAAGDLTFNLKLAPRDLLARNYRAEETGVLNNRVALPRPEVQTYRGTVTGKTNSSVRLIITENKIEGFIAVDNNRFYLEPMRKYSTNAAADEVVFYEEKDVLTDSATLSCALPTQIEKTAQNFGLQNLAPNAFRVAEIATDGDFEFVNATGGSTNANLEILSILNMIEDKYEQELNLTFSVTYQHAWTTPDPFNPSVRPASLPANIPSSPTNNMLGWFQQTWNGSFPTAQYPRDMAHLFSGKPQIFGQGSSYIGTICVNPGAAYGMHSWVNSAPEKFLLGAHELGHTFGASHVDGNPSCASTIMLAQLSFLTNFTFCQFSRDQIGGFINANGGCLAVQTTAKTKYDFDGDAKADVTVYRPSSGDWFTLRSSTGAATGAAFGAPTDRIVPEDYDGDGKTDIAVYRPSGGNWYLLLSATNTIAGTAFGAPDDIPVPADLSGDGKAEIVVFRPATGSWFSLNLQTGGFGAIDFGQNGDVPLPNDFDADGKADIAVYRPAAGTWYVLRSTAGFYSTYFGAATDKPVPADFDGDAKTDVAVYRPGNGTWYILRSTNGVIDSAFFGAATDIPAPADFDGDGKADVNVFRPAGGNWYRLNSGNGAFAAALFGANGDIPAPAAYVR